MNTAYLPPRTGQWFLSFIAAAAFCLAGAMLNAQSSRTTPPTEAEKEIDIRQMRQIFDALQAYRKQHDKWPNYLSDLVPGFLPDPEVLVSPVERRTGRARVMSYGDPRLPCSYIFEFSAHVADHTVNQGREVPLKMSEWKPMQMEEFGPAIPILRCHSYDPVLNIAVSGDFYETRTSWESDENTYALVKRLGIGRGMKDQKFMRVQVLDAATGDPLSGVEVIASNRRTDLGPMPPRSVTTDSAGECRVPLGGGIPVRLALAFQKEGYANAPILWSSTSAIPETYIAKLDLAVTVGGMVRDTTGKALSDVTVEVAGVVRDDVGQFLTVLYDTAKTDAEGRWSGQVPRSFRSLTLKLTHPEHLPEELDEVDSDEPERGEVSRQALLAVAAQLEMRPGITVEGVVLGTDAKPLPGAEMMLRGGSEPVKTWRQQTGEEGRFRFVVLEEGDFHLVAQAAGHGPGYRLLEIADQIEPLQIELDKGRTIRGKAIGHKREPVAGVTISVASWHDLPLLNWSTRTDSEGNFEWNHAPVSQVTFTASKQGMNSTTQMAGAREDATVTFLLTQQFLLTGNVIDAETKEPIPEFRIVRGDVWSSDDDVSWSFHSEEPGKDGSYSITLDRESMGGRRLRVLIRADGYLPAVSATVPETGWHTNDFELKKGRGPSGVVRLPNGAPAEGAEVAIQGAGYLSLGHGSFMRFDQRGTFLTKTDAEGKFALPALLPSPTIVAVHEQGYAELNGDELAGEGVITLSQWGRIRGVLKDGTRPVAGEQVTVASGTGVRRVQYDFERFRTTTDSEGRFEFSFVPPGERQLVRLIPMDRGWRWSDQQRLTVGEGATTEVQYGGTGRPVIGKAKLSQPDRKVDWNAGHHTLRTPFPRPPQGGFSSIEEAQAWSNSPEMKKARENMRQYALRFSEDGSFRVSNVLPGTYQLEIRPQEPSGDQTRSGRFLGQLTQEVTVPEIDGGVTDEPLDLGELPVEVRTP
jgi:hypothetical protein